MINPKVTIGIAVYNNREYIEECIASVCRQTYKNIKVIISDDCSKDLTEKELIAYTRHLENCEIYRQPRNIGLGENFKFLLSKAGGDYFCWLAADDILAPDWIEALVHFITEEDAVVRGRLNFKYDDRIEYAGKPSDFEQGQFIKYFLEDDTKLKALYLYGLFKLDVLNKMDCRLLQVDYIGDLLFVHEVLKYGNMRACSNTTSTFRRHSKNTGLKQLERYTGLLRYIFKVFPLQYYKNFYLLERFSQNKVETALLFIFKHFKSQFELWSRGLRRILS